MKRIISGGLALSMLMGFGLNGEAVDQQKPVSRQQINQAKAFPTFHGSYVGAPLKGRFDEDGLDIWYLDAKDFVADGTHLEFNLDWDIYGTMFTSKADADAGRVYNRYFQRNDETMYFPLSWSGRQYLILEGYPGDTYSVPFSVSRYEPIDLTRSTSVQAKTTTALIVQTKAGMVRGSSLGATSVQALAPELRLEKLTYRSVAEATQAKRKLEQSRATAYVEYDTPIKAFGADAFKKHQWSLLNTGQKKGVKGADIGLTAMQKRIAKKKQATTLVAVIDSGVNPSYADFAGKVRMDLGYDFVNRSKTAWDDHGHGSHVAGVIAAGSDNTYGMTGINAKASIIPIKVLDENGAGYTSDLVSGINHAVKKGAKVINLSLGGDTSSKSVESAFAYAKSKNVLVVAASGNAGKKTVAYPARSKYVFSVGATGRTDKRASFSNYGTGLDLVAPGVEIPSYLADGEMAFASGTSMAAPHVAAVASVLYSLKPTIKASDVESFLKKSAKDLGTKGYDTTYGYGRLNADRATSYIK
ncbi:S8 family peptidase [Exiguobacterium artemiae]|uniref:S8 family peptidase n=1 Tax=Exiguobacterium artemiae TaxID=340145 RepID=UPI0029643D71|nr:S8 family peptidase [Exiguobacterium sibiricum]MDW2886760.1 S8 family peptidase [Exiguobacterium sibiricum]